MGLYTLAQQHKAQPTGLRAILTRRRLKKHVRTYEAAFPKGIAALSEQAATFSQDLERIEDILAKDGLLQTTSGHRYERTEELRAFMRHMDVENNYVLQAINGELAPQPTDALGDVGPIGVLVSTAALAAATYLQQISPIAADTFAAVGVAAFGATCIYSIANRRASESYATLNQKNPLTSLGSLLVERANETQTALEQNYAPSTAKIAFVTSSIPGSPSTRTTFSP
ncbi:MAG: hypothetical protein OXR66_07435 [Candidatus Woesearchaeota archaeon]|nr:hypothetical protein [Candidatus Woesearchaeota archaeon]